VTRQRAMTLGFDTFYVLSTQLLTFLAGTAEVQPTDFVFAMRETLLNYLSLLAVNAALKPILNQK